MALERINESTLRLIPPLIDAEVRELQIGTQVLITGTIYTARDAAHKRLIEALDNGVDLPIDLTGQLLYYVGPTPPRPGRVSGAAGPTTAMRMDAFTPRLLAAGLKACMGKGNRGPTVRAALAQHTAVYLMAVGGAGALLASFIQSVEVVAYADLGTESLKKMRVVDFPAIVMNDCHGGDLLTEGRKRYCNIEQLDGYIPSERIVISAG